MASSTEKIRENLLRRMAARQGLMLTKSRRRDPRALDFGSYWLNDPRLGATVFGDEWGASLDEVEKFLTSDRRERHGDVEEPQEAMSSSAHEVAAVERALRDLRETTP
jgi:hypothetical protein